MNFNNIPSASSRSIVELSDKPREVIDDHMPPQARLDQRSLENLRRAGSGNIALRVIEERNAGEKRTCQLSDIRATRTGYQVTVRNDQIEHAVMPLELPEQESLQSAQENLEAGEYKVQIRRNAEGNRVCRVSENAGLKGGAPSPKSARD